MAKGLTKKQQVFVREYLIDLNATRAAVAAGYSEKTAESQGSRLLRNVKVAQEVAQKTGKRLEKLDISADYVLENIKEIGERCLQRSPVMVGQGKFRRQATELVTVVVKDETTGAESTQEVEADVWQFDSFGALKAQELLGKHLKLFTDKVEHTGKDGGPIEVTDARQKLFEKLGGTVPKPAARGKGKPDRKTD